MSKNTHSEVGALPSGHIEDLRGVRFGTLVVEEFSVMDKYRRACWVCKCDCGNTTTKNSYYLKNAKTVSCGCVSTRPKRNNVSTHHMSRTRIYKIWKSMRKRCSCTNPTQREYRDYFARGIKVCDEWNNSFEPFYEWAMANGYNDSLSIDRINNDGNYEPSNCRWVDNTTQQRNRRKTVFLEYNGEKRALSEWCEIYKLNMKTVYGRLHNYRWTNPQEILFGKGGAM